MWGNDHHQNQLEHPVQRIVTLHVVEKRLQERHRRDHIVGRVKYRVNRQFSIHFREYVAFQGENKAGWMNIVFFFDFHTATTRYISHTSQW